MQSTMATQGEVKVTPRSTISPPPSPSHPPSSSSPSSLLRRMQMAEKLRQTNNSEERDGVSGDGVSGDADGVSGNGASCEDEPTKQKKLLLWLRRWWRLVVIVMVPLILSPLPISIGNNASRAAYAIAIIAIYWLTEALPIALTALLPLWMFPALGVLSAKDTAQSYMSDANMLFVGGLMVSVAIEKWNLHKRIGLLVLMTVGSKPKWLLLGFMCTTAFLSMWISNTATAAMMLAVAHAVLVELEEERKLEGREGREDETSPQIRVIYHKTNRVEVTDQTPLVLEGEEGEEEGVADEEEEQEEEDKVGEEEQVLIEVKESGKREVRMEEGCVDDRNLQTLEKEKAKTQERLCKVLVLGVAYAANIGGTATLTGTGPNIVLAGLSVSIFPESGGINFGLWFAFAAPTMLLTLFCSWLYLSLIYCDDSAWWCKRKFLGRRYQFHGQKVKKVIREQYKKLGPIKYAEVMVLLLFVLLAFLWLFREPRFIPGWASMFRSKEGANYFSDSSTVMFVVFLLFVVPSQPCWPGTGCYSAGRTGYTALLDWNSVQTQLPWNVIILLGSGFALSDAAKESGLSIWLGGQLLGLRNLPNPVIALCVSAIITLVTEVMSNVATTTLFLPVLAQLGVELGVNPLFFMIGATVSASYAFMLPVATPPNAMAFSYGYLKVYDMVLTGVFMNVLCVGIITVALNTTGRLIFQLDSLPSWAQNNNTSRPTCLEWDNLTRSW